VRKALFLLGILNDGDLDWMIAAGGRRERPEWRRRPADETIARRVRERRSPQRGSAYNDVRGG